MRGGLGEAAPWGRAKINIHGGPYHICIYLYDHPAGDKEVRGGERIPEEGSHHEGKNKPENKMEKHAY